MYCDHGRIDGEAVDQAQNLHVLDMSRAEKGPHLPGQEAQGRTGQTGGEAGAEVALVADVLSMLTGADRSGRLGGGFCVSVRGWAPRPHAAPPLSTVSK